MDEVKKVKIDKNQETGIEGQVRKGKQDNFELHSQDFRF